jgi:biotin carboxyl carrier protein
VEYRITLKRRPGSDSLVAEVSDKPVKVVLLEADPQRVEMVLGGERLSFQRPAAALSLPSQPTQPQVASDQRGLVVAPMPGKVIGTLVKEGEKVKAGDPLLILESMKMEVAVRADRDSEVLEILVKEGSSVKRGQGLVKLG